MADDALVLDLSLMRGIHVDPERRIVRAQGGALWEQVDRETQAFGLATPGGRVTTTGVGGFTLGGGYGWLSPKYGLTCDNLLSVDVVTADGRLVRASEEQNEELFWRLRGGGGNFGVATSFELRLHPVGPLVYGGLLLFPIERAAEVTGRWRDLGASRRRTSWRAASRSTPRRPRSSCPSRCAAGLRSACSAAGAATRPRESATSRR